MSRNSSSQEKSVSTFTLDEAYRDRYETKEIAFFISDDSICDSDEYYLEFHSLLNVNRVPYAQLLSDIGKAVSARNANVLFRAFKFVDTLIRHFHCLLEDNSDIAAQVRSILSAIKGSGGAMVALAAGAERRLEEAMHREESAPVTYELCMQFANGTTFPFGISPVEVAHHLTYRHCKLISAIRITEWFEFSATTDRRVKEERSKNLLSYMTNLQMESQFISDNIKDLVSLTFWMSVGEEALNLCDFSLVFVISSSFVSKKVKKIEKKLPQHFLDVLAEINNITDSTSNFANFNQRQKKYKSAYVIPYLGIEITQWVWMNELLKQDIKDDPSKSTNVKTYSRYAERIQKINKKWGNKIEIQINDCIYDLIDKLILTNKLE